MIGSWSKLDIAESQILPISMAESGFGEQETARRDDYPSPLNAAKSLRVTKAKVIPRRELTLAECF